MSFQISSICKKQIVAATGLMLVLYIIGHLVGNLFIYGGAEAFNGYAAKLESLGVVLKIVEYVLLSVFLIHILFTVLVVCENIKARGGLGRYAVDVPMQKRSIATRLMPYSGVYIFGFVIWHIYDFTWVDREGIRSFIHGQNYGLYGIVVNAFKDPLHSALYVIAVLFLGLHLSHGVQSVFQSFGVNNRCMACVRKTSALFGFLIAVGFASIPLYVLWVLK